MNLAMMISTFYDVTLGDPTLDNSLLAPVAQLDRAELS